MSGELDWFAIAPGREGWDAFVERCHRLHQASMHFPGGLAATGPAGEVCMVRSVTSERVQIAILGKLTAGDLTLNWEDNDQSTTRD